MKIEIAEPGRMTQSGSSLLRLIQNNKTPVLDLLVRESIQNSLDAHKQGARSVTVEYLTGTFSSHKLGAELEGLSGALAKRFPADRCQYLAVCDSDTVGLTGESDGFVVEGIPVAGTGSGIEAFGRNDDLAVFDVALADNDAVVDGAGFAKSGLFNTVVDKTNELGHHGSITGRGLHRSTAFDRCDTSESYSVQTGGEQQSKRQLADGLESSSHNRLLGC